MRVIRWHPTNARASVVGGLNSLYHCDGGPFKVAMQASATYRRESWQQPFEKQLASKRCKRESVDGFEFTQIPRSKL
ncbi:hypothetical protein EVAR_55127_1 [Eumeta japonica]|uniref:Uncharacterized protein n=1 Tax=Eumeta variegata TaxID=151549 RepID=A0A4C1YCH5_EUMVA|nr:hypothetical protein EVAR_55127_1 [Eumeta japonica]